MIKITECPRDAMQGIKEFIPTELKVNYLNQLLKVGFDVLDFGSFVSPKAIPQMQDTADVLKQLNLTQTKSKLLSIVANVKGATDACSFDEISYLGFPFSISETFQMRNTNSSIEESLKRVEEIQNMCVKSNKKLVVYISMAFGNPYGDVWSPQVAIDWCRKLSQLNIEFLPLADTIGCSTKENITELFGALIPELKNVQFGAHLHSTQDKSSEKINAAYKAGCRSFDVAIHGLGGCPMAKDDLTGNIATEDLIAFIQKESIQHQLNIEQLELCYRTSWDIFNKYH